MIKLSAYLTELGGLLFGIASIIGIVFAGRWLLKPNITSEHKKTIVALIMIFLSIGITRIYWHLAIILSPGGVGYHPQFLHCAYIPMTLAGLLYVFATIQFVDIAHQVQPWRKWLIFSFIVLIASLTAALPPLF